MCFARTFALYESIDEVIKTSMPSIVYVQGCLFISLVAADALKKRGITDAVPTLVGLWRARSEEWIPHYVLIRDGEVLDFKHRSWGRFEKKIVTVDGRLAEIKRVHFVRPDVVATAQELGWFPNDALYKSPISPFPQKIHGAG